MFFLFGSFVLALVSALFHQHAEAVIITDLDRVLTTCDRSRDTCRYVTKTTGHESRKDADRACELALEAFDRIKLNTCHHWSDAKCRVMGDDLFAQCTCKVHDPNKHFNGGEEVTKTFRECASVLRNRELQTAETLAPYINFREVVMTDMNRVLTTFNRGTDTCVHVNNTTSHESRTAADTECKEALEALDRLGLKNTCTDWHDAKCQVIGNNLFAQCTCLVVSRKDRNREVATAFRECASVLKDQEERKGLKLAPSINFQEVCGLLKMLKGGVDLASVESAGARSPLYETCNL